MNIVLSGGGTAGHINPALATATILMERGHSVYFAGTPTGVEAQLVTEAGVLFRGFEAAGFNRNHPKSIFRALRLMVSSAKKACSWFGEIRPDVVVCFGGYVCIPVGRAAMKRGVPIVVHEQNSVMGMANKYLSHRARSVALTYEIAGAAVSDKGKIIVTGNPVRRSVFAATRKEGRDYLGMPQDAPLLVVFGGSLGARHINTAITSLKDKLLAHEDLYIHHITGPKELETVRGQLALSDEESRRYSVVGYENQMGKALAACDMVVSRSGATSLAEISALHIPALLVPFPYATADHQTMNAREYVKAQAALLVPDDQVEGLQFEEKLMRLVEDGQLRSSMAQASRSFGTLDAAQKLAEVVIAAAS